MSATLNGRVINDGGFVCDVRFQWGPTTALGTDTPWQGDGLTMYRTGDTFSQIITGLAPNTIYFFRAQVRNIVGTVSGSILSFITTGGDTPSVQTRAASDITEETATLNGLVLSGAGRYGAVRFEYGATSALGMKTPWIKGFGTGDTFAAAVSGLSPGKSYSFRSVFQGSPPVYGSILSFATLSRFGIMTLASDEFLILQQFMKP